MYRRIIRPILFNFDAESVHDFTVQLLKFTSQSPFMPEILSNFTGVDYPELKNKVFGLEFKNPLGLAAGFDKNVKCPRAWPMLGFGFAEFGSVTFSRQSGNQRPRLWRLPKDKALIVNLGLNGDGAVEIKKRLERFQNNLKRDFVTGVSIAKTSAVSEESAHRDYLETFQTLYDFSDYLTLNVSCPNVAGFSEMQYGDFLEKLLFGIVNTREKFEIRKPILIKIGPQEDLRKLDEIIAAAQKYSIDGIIATNLRKESRPPLKDKNQIRPGGLSGKPIQDVADRTIAYIYRKTGGKMPIIGVGGIFDGVDAYNKIKAGASLLQIATGFIYGGPLAARRILSECRELLIQDGFSNISDAVGKAASSHQSIN